MLISFWIVKPGNSSSRVHVIVGVIGNRENAKRRASHWLGGDPNTYVAEPLTMPGDQVHLDITVQV